MAGPLNSKPHLEERDDEEAAEAERAEQDAPDTGPWGFVAPGVQKFASGDDEHRQDDDVESAAKLHITPEHETGPEARRGSGRLAHDGLGDLVAHDRHMLQVQRELDLAFGPVARRQAPADRFREPVHCDG